MTQDLCSLSLTLLAQVAERSGAGKKNKRCSRITFITVDNNYDIPYFSTIFLLLVPVATFVLWLINQSVHEIY